MPDHDDLEPSPAEMGDTMTLQPGVWEPLDEIGTQIDVYGDKAVDVAIQYAEVGDEVRRLHSEADRLRAELASATTLIRDLTDPDPCSFDHHGGCQAHGYLSLEPGEKCPHAEAKELLDRHNAEA